jgi:putative membrane-bound dehydrogenase-like protein
MRHTFILICTVALATQRSWGADPPTAANPDRPLPANEAPHRMTVPDGFRVTLFAGEPDVVQPIAMTTDDRGRLWVVENHSYPGWADDGEGRDRILIFEDAEGDGRFDKRTVFYDKGANLSGIALGFGGVWLCSTPNFVFIPDRDGDDRPDGPPVVKLDGFSREVKHNAFNGLTWGPDGWLWGCHGILATSLVGKPGTPEKDRVPINCGVWRYHPTREVFEVVAWGTTNPWGIDFDDFGEAFISNCVIDHLWHVIPGAHYERMYGQDLNPHVYGLMKACSDHRHWGGGHWTTSRGGQGVHSDPGGGHAHSGTLVYLGDNFPDAYRNCVFTCNIHGNRVNRDRLQRRGSGYVGTHEPDFLLANDPWFRGVALCPAADGGVYVADWCDTGECHNYKDVDRSNGRIYKVTFGTPKPFRGDVAKLKDAELVELQLHKNDWFVRRARRVLQERVPEGRPAVAVLTRLHDILRRHADVARRLRAMWALHATDALDADELAQLFQDRDENVRAWAIQLALDRHPLDRMLYDGLWTLSQTEASPRVHVALASGLQRMPPSLRWVVAPNLAQHLSDTTEPSLSRLVWYGIESLVVQHRGEASSMLHLSKSSFVRQSIARRVASAEGGPNMAVAWLAADSNPELQRDVVHGLQEALRGRRAMLPPAEWAEAYRRLAANRFEEVRDRAAELAVLFGDERAMATLRAVANDASAAASKRHQALHALLNRPQPDFVPLLHGLLTDAAVRGPAVRGLAAFDDPTTAALVLKHYPDLTDAEKADAVQTLASRPVYALALLDAVENGRIPRRDLSAFTVRQMQALKDKRVSERLERVWGASRRTSQDRAAQAAKYKALLTPAALQSSDLGNGRKLYTQNCASCHKLFGEGGTVGPELTGAQRANLDYILENVLDPSAAVPGDYRVTELELASGRVLSGVVVEESAQAVTVQTPAERVVVPKAEIAGRNQSPVSMMPEGILDKLTEAEVRDLVAYLGSPRQVPSK